MIQANKFVETQAKAIESAKALADIAIENAKAVSEIQLEVLKDALATTHIKACHLLSIKEPKEVLEVVKPEYAQTVIAEVAVVQSKVTKVIRKANHQVIEMIESAIDESKTDLKKVAKESMKHVPTGFEGIANAFDYVFDAALQTFDQAYIASKDAYIAFEKTVDSAMTSLHGQVAPAGKPAAKTRKAIAA